MLRGINWKQSGRIVLWTTVAVLAVNAGRMVYTGLRARAASPTAYRSSGRRKSSTVLEPLRPPTTMLKLCAPTAPRCGEAQPITRRSARLISRMATGSQLMTSQGERALIRRWGFPAPRDPKESCTNAQELSSGRVIDGEDNIGGHRAVRIVNVMGSRKFTMWYALDLACAVLQQRFQHETGETDQNLAAVIIGEPDAALFQLPTSLKEVPPSVLYRCPEGLQGCKELPDQANERFDKTYNDARSKAAANSPQQ